METRSATRRNDAAEARWSAMFAELEEWHRQNGSWAVPHPTKKSNRADRQLEKLAQWADEMRTLKREGRLPREQEERLDRIGFDWDASSTGATTDPDGSLGKDPHRGIKQEEQATHSAAGSTSPDAAEASSSSMQVDAAEDNNNGQVDDSASKKRRRNPSRMAKKHQGRYGDSNFIFENFEAPSAASSGRSTPTSARAAAAASRGEGDEDEEAEEGGSEEDGEEDEEEDDDEEEEDEDGGKQPSKKKARRDASAKKKSGASNNKKKQSRSSDASKKRNGDQQWEERFEELVRFKEAHGHFRVPVKDMPLLKYWVQNQKITYRKGKLSDERIARLESIGFSWVHERKKSGGSSKAEASSSTTANSTTSTTAIAAEEEQHKKRRTSPRSSSPTQGVNKRHAGDNGGDNNNGAARKEDSADDATRSQHRQPTATSSAESTARAPSPAMMTHSPHVSGASQAYYPGYMPSPGINSPAMRYQHSSPYMQSPAFSSPSSSAAAAAAAVAAASKGPGQPSQDRYLTVREAKEYIFSRIEGLERRQDELHRHMVELRQAFKGMERFIMQHFSRERETAERLRAYGHPSSASGNVWHQHGYRNGEPQNASGSAGEYNQGKGYPPSYPSASAFSGYPASQHSTPDMAMDRERVANAGYMAHHHTQQMASQQPQYHQYPGGYGYAYPASSAPQGSAMRAGMENPYPRHVTSPLSGSTYTRSPTPSNSTTSPSSHINSALGSVTSPRTPQDASIASVHAAQHMSPSLGPSALYGVPAGQPGAAVPLHHQAGHYAGGMGGGHVIPGHGQPGAHPTASYAHPHPMPASSSSSSPSHPSQPSSTFHPPPRSSPIVGGSPLTSRADTPEAVQTPPAHGSHFVRNPSAPSVASVTPIPPSIVHQYPPPEEVAPTLSPPRPRMSDLGLVGGAGPGYGFPSEGEDGPAATRYGGALRTASQQDLQHQQQPQPSHTHARSAPSVVDPAAAMVTDENGEELLKELDTFC